MDALDAGWRMMEIKRLGFFSEFGGATTADESMTDAVSGEQWLGEVDVVRYLGSGCRCWTLWTLT